MSKKDKKIENKILKAIHKQFNQVKNSYQDYHNNPYKSDYVHRLRVDMRKNRTLLNFLKPLITSDMYESFNKGLKDLGERLSPLRDLDTLIEECALVASEEPNLIDNYALVFRFLEKERLKLVKKQSTEKAFQEFEEVLDKTEKLLNELTFDLNNNETTLVKEVDKRYQHKIKKLEKAYDKLDRADYEDVHEVRKHAKKVRYTSTGFKKLFPKKQRKAIRKYAKTVQDDLGEITDTYMSVELLELYKEKVSTKTLAESFQKLINYHQRNNHYLRTE